MITGTTGIKDTPKGARIWIEALENKGIQKGGYYMATYAPDAITVEFIQSTEKPKGYRSNGSAGGIVDLQSKKVTAWAQGSTVAQWTVQDEHTLIIKRV